jgi:hypothetical protein
MAAEGIPVEVACRVVGVSVSGYYDWRSRPPSARAIRHAWLTDLIVEVHQASRGVYGPAGCMPSCALATRSWSATARWSCGAPRWGGRGGRPAQRHAKPDQVAADLVDRQFARTGPNQLWLTDITEHPTLEGKVYCAVVLDAFSRRVVGWSIDASPTAALVTNALGMAIDRRTPRAVRSPAGKVRSPTRRSGTPGSRRPAARTRLHRRGRSPQTGYTPCGRQADHPRGFLSVPRRSRAWSTTVAIDRTAPARSPEALLAS